MPYEVNSYPHTRILVVDDNSPNLLAMCAVLEELGHEVVCARSCKEALRLTQEHSFAVILLDVQLGDGDGFDVLSALQRRREFATPVLFLSAVYDAAIYSKRAYRLGALDFIAKPFDPDVLRGKVSALVLLYQRGEELKRAKASIESKDRTLSIVSHDLRNPLQSIAVGAAMLQQQLDGKPKATAVRIARSAKRMEVMIRDLLDYARGRFAGGIPVTFAPVDVKDLCTAAIEELLAVYPDREIALACEDGLVLQCDGARVEQAVSNLLGNAIEHSSGPIRVSVEGTEGAIEIRVHNGPPCIPPEKIGRLFEPFHKGDQSGGGLGLGLHIVREIAMAHRGEVTVESSSAMGTVFTVRLPRR
ncbi:MAG TPA: hybrid sensor histidine kinase/response regulator [Polyangia bacterium]